MINFGTLQLFNFDRALAPEVDASAEEKTDKKEKKGAEEKTDKKDKKKEGAAKAKAK